MNINHYGKSMVGSTGINGDVFYVSHDQKVFLLADGASGAGEHGKVLMGKTCVDIATEFDYSISKFEPKEYVDKLLNKINQRLIELSQEYKKGVCGTIIIAIVDNETLTVTTLGDSPAYLCSNNSIFRVAKNQRRYENLIDQGHITREEYDDYISRLHYMMSACFEIMLPSLIPNNIIEQYKIKEGDIFVLCCDGLSNWVSQDNIFKSIKKNGLQKGVDDLIETAKQLSLKTDKKFDDTTALALQWTS